MIGIKDLAQLNIARRRKRPAPPPTRPVLTPGLPRENFEPLYTAASSQNEVSSQSRYVPGTLIKVPTSLMQNAKASGTTDLNKLKPPPSFPPPPRKPATASDLPPAKVRNYHQQSMAALAAPNGPSSSPSSLETVSDPHTLSSGLAQRPPLHEKHPRVASPNVAKDREAGSFIGKAAPPGYWKPPPPSASVPEHTRSMNREGARGILTPLSVMQMSSRHPTQDGEIGVSETESNTRNEISSTVSMPLPKQQNSVLDCEPVKLHDQPNRTLETQEEIPQLNQAGVEHTGADSSVSIHSLDIAQQNKSSSKILGRESYNLEEKKALQTPSEQYHIISESKSHITADALMTQGDDIETDTPAASRFVRKARPKLTLDEFETDAEGCDGEQGYQAPSLEFSLNISETEERRASLDSNVGKKGTRKGPSALLSLEIESDTENDQELGHGGYDYYDRMLTRNDAESTAGKITIGGLEVCESGIRSDSVSEASVKHELVMMTALGQGAGGIVYKAIHIPTLRLVAVKTIPVYDPLKRSQMLKEIKALYENMAPISGYKRQDESFETPLKGPISHAPCPFIVTFHDAFMNPEMANVSMVVEYMDGGSLQDIIDAGGCDNEGVLSQIAYRILRGLQFIHDRHQIHRDIKPSNLLINHRGEVKISDFGIVRELESTQAMASTFVGTMTYMSPERISGLSYGANSDIWSFGLSLLSVALGKYPLVTAGGYWALLSSLNEGPVPRLPDDRFSPIIIDFIDQCLTRDPALRPSCEQLMQHPFVTQSQAFIDIQMANGEDVPPTDSESNLSELDELVQALVQEVAAAVRTSEEETKTGSDFTSAGSPRAKSTSHTSSQSVQTSPLPPDPSAFAALPDAASVPGFAEHHLRNVSRQLGVSFSIVESKFRCADLLS